MSKIIDTTANNVTMFGIINATIAEEFDELFSHELDVTTIDKIIVITAEKTPISVKT